VFQCGRQDGQSPPEMAKTVKQAFMASRFNTYVSIPMLFGMGAASHFPRFEHWMYLAVLAVGVLFAHVLIMHSHKVGSKI